MKNAIDFLSRLANSPTPYFAVDCFDTSNIAEEGREEGFPVELLYMMTMCECIRVKVSRSDAKLLRS